MKSRFFAAALALLLLTAAAGCGEDPQPTQPDDEKGLSGELTVFAASSLSEVFEELGAAFEKENPRANVEFNFGASSALVEQVKAGSPADIVATADEETLRRLETEVRRRTVFARNSLEIVVAKDNPLGIKGLEDLARADVTLVLCAAEVPCGKLAQEVFDRAGVKTAPKSLESNVKAVLSKVALGEADAGVVYRTDIAADNDKVQGVHLRGRENVITGYPIGRVASSKNEDLADAFISFVLSGEGQRILQAAGFSAP